MDINIRAETEKDRCAISEIFNLAEEAWQMLFIERRRA
jgi:hypothetical protein